MLIRTEAPAHTPVSLLDAKDYMKVEHSEDDALITGLIFAATKHLEGIDGLLGRALISQRMELRLGSWPARIIIPIAPVIEVTAVRYRDPARVEQTLPGSRYQVTGIGSSSTSEVLPSVGISWPATDCSEECITVEFVAGYGATPYDVPADIRQALLMHVASLYANREALGPNDIGALPLGYSELVAGHRLWGFG